MKKEYILKRWPEDIDADPAVIARLQQFVNHCLRVDGCMTKALEAEIYGKHKEETHAEDQSGK